MSKRLDIARGYGFKGTEEDLRAAASIVVASTPPAEPALGDIWIDPVTGAVGVAARTQSEDLEESGPTIWRVPGDSINQTFDTRDAALARAWEITPAGGQRPEPVRVSGPVLVDRTWSVDWISENTLRWIGYTVENPHIGEWLEKLKRTALVEMTARVSGTGMFMDPESFRSYSLFDAERDQYRVEITMKAVPR